MANDDLLLGIDVGTTNCKAILFDLIGRPVACASAPTPTHRPQPNWAEYDPVALWETVAGTIRAALSHVAPARVRGVAVASMGESGVLIDAQGTAVSPIVAWYDSRTAPQHRWWMEHCDARSSFAIAGVRPDPIFGVYKLMWLRDHMPAAYARAASWLHVADYIAFRLSGVRATDYSLATRTMLLDLQQRRWSEDLVARAGLRRDLLPDLVPSGCCLGSVTPEAAAATGLLPGTVVGSGGHDHVCGAFAAGVIFDHVCLDSMGTAEAVFLPLDTLSLTSTLGEANSIFGAHVAADRYYMMDGLWTSGAAIEWAIALLFENGGDVTEDRAHAYSRLEALARQAPPGSLGVLFVPQLAGGEHGTFVGLTTDTGRPALARAVYEGVAYEWRRYLELTEKTRGVRARTIKVIGGGTRSALWLQIKADILGRPLHVLEVEESVALGAALLAGLAADVFRDEADALAQLHRDERIVLPDAERAGLYNRLYHDAFLQVAPALSATHRALASLALGA